VVETYSCALSLKIILQGRLYVTNRNLFFHSYFNDKTIFGKETKYLVSFKNIQSIEKKYNAVVFDNSIGVVTKDKKGIFFTSFVYRDQAFTLIQNLLDQFRAEESGQPLPESEVKSPEAKSPENILQEKTILTKGQTLASNLVLEEVKEDLTNEHLRNSIPFEEEQGDPPEEPFEVIKQEKVVPEEEEPAFKEEEVLKSYNKVNLIVDEEFKAVE